PTVSYFKWEHGPFVRVKTAELLRDFVVREMTDRIAFTSDGSGGECERLPSVSDVVQAVSIGPVTVLPGLAPCNAGQNKYNWSRVTGPRPLKSAERTLSGHMRGRTVVIQPIGPLLQTSCEEMEFSGMKIPGGWIHAQRVPVSAGRNMLGCAHCGGIEQ